MEVVKWNHFVKSKVQDTLRRRLTLALRLPAFLSGVPRERPPVLLYKALFALGHGAAASGVAGGDGDRSSWARAAAVVVYVAISRFGVPACRSRPFFCGHQRLLLYYMAFVFAGKGGGGAAGGRGAVSTTVVRLGAPHSGARHLLPHTRARSTGSCCCLLAVAALVWTFKQAPPIRHSSSTCRAAPDGQGPGQYPSSVSAPLLTADLCDAFPE